MEGNGHVHDAGVMQPGALTGLDTPAAATTTPEGRTEPDLLMTRVALGLVLLAVAAVRSLLERLVPGDEPPVVTEDDLGVLSSALIGVAVETERRAVVVTNAVVNRATPFVSFVAGRPLLGFPLRAVGGEVARWAERGRVEQRRGRATAETFLRDLVPEVVRAVLEQIDIDAVVAEVDLDRILDRVDMERVLGRIDMDEVITRVDVNRVVERIDVDAVIGRVDVNAVVNRVDLPGITEQVMDEVNIGEVIRESTGSVTTQAVDAVRFQGMSMDRFVARVVDRMLMRRGERGTPAESPPPEPQPAEPTAGAP